MDYISLCLLSYNRLNFIKKSLASIFLNTVTPYELLVNDDGSTPDVKDYLYGLLREGKISYLTFNGGKNQGVGKAINNLFKIASGRYFIKMDQDLEYVMGWDRKVIDIMDSFPEVGVLGLFKYYHDPVDFKKMYIRTEVRNNISVEMVQDFVGSAMVVRPFLYNHIGMLNFSSAFAEDVVFKKALQDLGYKLALPTGDLATNYGFGPPNSTVCYKEGDEIKVTSIHKKPLIINKG